MLVIELAQARRHFAGAGSGRGHDNDGTGGLDIVVFAVALVRDDELDVRGIVVDRIMAVNAHAERLELVFKEVCGMLAVILRDDDAADVQSDGAEGVDQPHHVHVVRDAEVAAALAHFDVRGVDGNDDLRLLLELKEHFDLAVRLEARQHARGVVIVKELAAELQIELSAEVVDPLKDLL